MKKAILIACLLSAACQSSGTDSEEGEGQAIPADPHSFARPNEVRVSHVDLDLTLDFERSVALGSVRLELERAVHTAPLVVDTLGLAIAKVEGNDRRERSFQLGAESPGFGRPLTIQLEPTDREVTITYETTPGAESLQWLGPEQTAGGRYPFLFSQGQSILTRSWIPLQDTPGVRVTYEAKVRAPEPLVVVMSARQAGRSEDGSSLFRLEQPIPAYLIALACGELESRAISERCAVWAEPSMLAAAHAEFIDTERMIQSAEGLFGPYRWGRYDVIVLPPAFPFGGMENPLLTFLTPTVIAGDRSLTSLIAHELAHSWSGNLVTNATWSDFWLNEGFTVYFEQRIVEEVYGPERASMERKLDLDKLHDLVAGMEPWETVLHIDLQEKHPEDGFSSIPYDKGALFLRRLEEVVGRERLDAFLRSWFDSHAFQSVTTADFEAFLRRELLAEVSVDVFDVQEWLYEPGLPAQLPATSSDAFERVDRELSRWTSGVAASELSTEGWVTQQWLHFFAQLPPQLGSEKMEELDEAFGLTQTGNSEVLFSWLRLSIREGYARADERLETFLMTVGRRKFLQPLYEELAKTSLGLARARRIYADARERYHSVSRGSIDAVLKVDGPE